MRLIDTNIDNSKHKKNFIKIIFYFICIILFTSIKDKDKADEISQKEKNKDTDNADLNSSNSNSDKNDEDDEYFSTGKKRKNTFVGTAEYVSPEVLLGETIGPECDLWALGCMLYRFLAGKTPFKDKTEYLIFENIRKNNLNFPKVKIK